MTEGKSGATVECFEVWIVVMMSSEFRHSRRPHESRLEKLHHSGFILTTTILSCITQVSLENYYRRKSRCSSDPMCAHR